MSSTRATVAYRLGLLLVMLWLAGCSSAPSHAYEPPTLVVLLSATPTVTPVSTPTFTPTPTPTSTPVPTATPTATPTPRPTATATPLPTATPPTATLEVTATLTLSVPLTSSRAVSLSGRVEAGSFPSQVLGRQATYRIYLPPGYDTSGQSYPVLYVLHGYPYDESHWDRLGVDEVADAGILSGAYPPFIIVMPNGDPQNIYVNTSGGDWSVEGLIVNELLPYIDRTYRTLATREGRAIGGISRGGVWSLEIGFRHTDLFAVVGAHSAALSVNYPLPQYDPYNLVTEPGLRLQRIWLDAGNTDWARNGVRRLHEALQAQGVVHEYTEGEGNHSDGYWSAMMPAYLAFYVAGWR